MNWLRKCKKSFREKPVDFVILLGVFMIVPVSLSLIISAIINPDIGNNVKNNCPETKVTPPEKLSPITVANGTVIKIDGATSMVTSNENLKNGFEKKFPGTKVETVANGTDKGIQDLLAGRIDIAAASRPLTAQEQNQGLIAVNVGEDAIAVFVGKENPFKGGLTSSQIANIFQGNIKNWSEMDGSSRTIRVINRPPVSGTRQTFKEMFFRDGDFGTTPNITTMPIDGTINIIQALGSDGTGYATYLHVYKQTKVRVVSIDDLTPDAANYPYRRKLYYVYKNSNYNNGVKAFLDYATSPQGQQVLILGNLDASPQ